MRSDAVLWCLIIYSLVTSIGLGAAVATAVARGPGRDRADLRARASEPPQRSRQNGAGRSELRNAFGDLED